MVKGIETAFPEKALAEIAEATAPIVYGIVQPGPNLDTGVPFVQSRDVGSKIDLRALQNTSPDIAASYKRSSLKPGDILFSLRGDIGASSIAPAELEGANIARGIARIRVRDEYDHHYVRYALQAPEMQRVIARNANGSTFRELSIEEIRRLLLPVPTLPEQCKIAEILRTWDEAIEKLEALRAAKEQKARAIQQTLFETEYGRHYRMRRARDLLEPVSERARPDLPLLAVMQDVGIVRRDELDRRVAMPGGDTSAYKVVRPGDFVISLRSFEGGIEYSNITGLVSPAYTVLRPKTDLVGDYYRYLFKSRSFIGRLDKVIFGIRDGKQIAFRDFGDMLIPAPPREAQLKQAEALAFIDSELVLSDRQLDTLTRQKRGLMQKLLTGERRVHVDHSGKTNQAKEAADG